MSPIPFFRPSIGSEESTGVVASLNSGWLTTGPKVRDFERRFADAVGAHHAVALNSATAALHLSLLAYDIGPGDEVILPTMTFASGAEVVLAVGATPVLVDSSPDTLSIDIDQAIEAISSRTRAVMPMHYGGLPVNVDRLMEIASSRPNLVIIDDAAHAFPAKTDDGMIGCLTHGSCFSFYANKTITTGEGGMFTTNDEQIADRVRQLSLHGLSGDAWKRFETRAAWDYDIVEPGWKYNMTDLAASIGLVQLEKAALLAERRRSAALLYDELLSDLDGIELISLGQRADSAVHLYVIRIDPSICGVTRDDVIHHLGQQGIGTSVHYRPLHMHSYYRGNSAFSFSDFPIASKAFSEIVSLPLFPDLTNDEIVAVTEAVISASKA